MNLLSPLCQYSFSATFSPTPALNYNRVWTVCIHLSHIFLINSPKIHVIISAEYTPLNLSVYWEVVHRGVWGVVWSERVSECVSLQELIDEAARTWFLSLSEKCQMTEGLTFSSDRHNVWIRPPPPASSPTPYPVSTTLGPSNWASANHIGNEPWKCN